GKDVQSLLHDKARWRGHWPWPVYHSRHHREATFGVYGGRYAARRVYRGQNNTAARRSICRQTGRTSMSMLILLVVAEASGRRATRVAKSGWHELKRLPSRGEPTRLARCLSEAPWSL